MRCSPPTRSLSHLVSTDAEIIRAAKGELRVELGGRPGEDGRPRSTVDLLLKFVRRSCGRTGRPLRLFRDEWAGSSSEARRRVEVVGGDARGIRRRSTLTVAGTARHGWSRTRSSSTRPRQPGKRVRLAGTEARAAYRRASRGGGRACTVDIPRRTTSPVARPRVPGSRFVHERLTALYSREGGVRRGASSCRFGIGQRTRCHSVHLRQSAVYRSAPPRDTLGQSRDPLATVKSVLAERTRSALAKPIAARHTSHIPSIRQVRQARPSW